MIFTNFSRTIQKEFNQGQEHEFIEDKLENNIKTIQMRQNQLDVYENYKDSERLHIIQPPGSGKSACVMFNMAYRLKHYNNQHKIIIAVPQTFISKSFGNVNLKYPDGTEIHWDIYYDLCNLEDGYTSKCDSIINFLNSNNTNSYRKRVLITTHSALSITTRQINDIEKTFDNTTLVIDESHHILYSQDETNMMGKLIKGVNGNHNTSLWLITATPFRGDKNHIIPPEQKENFDEYFLPLDQHWEQNIKHIQQFDYNFVIYEDIFNNIKEIFQKTGKKKSIIYCPYYGNLINNSDKFQFRDKLIENIQEVWPDCNFMDLIDVNCRNQKKDLMLDDSNAKNIDIILTLKIFDEGSDWIHAEQCLDLCPSDSLRIQYQRFGRLWRDHNKKKHISYYTCIPKISNNDNIRDHLSNSYNSFAGSLLLQEVIKPVPFPKEKTSKKNINPFEEAISNEGTRQEVLEKVTKSLLFLKNSNENPDSNEIKTCISEVLDNYEIEDKNEEVLHHIVKILRSNNDNKKIKKEKPEWIDQTIDLSWMKDAGFDQIWDNEIFDHLLSFGTSVCNIQHFSEFRRIYSDCNNQKTLIEHRQNALKLAEENGGILPQFNQKFVKEHRGLVGVIYKYPSYFDDIVKFSETKPTHHEWYTILKEIQNRYNGSIPRGVLKKELGKQYQSLRCIKKDLLEKYNDLYLDDQVSIEDEITYIKNKIIDLQKSHKQLGIKLIKQELGESFYKKYRSYRNKHPDKFKDFNIDKLNMNLIISELERVQNEYGFIPFGSKQKEFGNLVKNISHIVKKHPEMIKHIKFETFEMYHNKRKSDIIEQLIKLRDQSEKITPELIQNHLSKDDYRYYNQNLRKNISNEIDGFKVIQKSCNSKIKELKKLNEKYGYIPNQKWLLDNNMKYLCHLIRTKSHVLKGIKQAVMNTKGEFSHFKTIGE